MSHDADQTMRAARHALEEARRALATAIHDYPTPISGCDAQFNHMLADRARVSAALRALDAKPFVATPRQPALGRRVESR